MDVNLICELNRGWHRFGNISDVKVDMSVLYLLTPHL